MASRLEVTSGVVRTEPVEGGTVTQSLTQCTDVARFDCADLVLYLSGLEGDVGTPTVAVITGMHADTEEGWVTLVEFTPTRTQGAAEKREARGLLNFVRWRVTGLSAGTSFSFSIDGMGRNN
jgi:hypothetical protein